MFAKINAYITKYEKWVIALLVLLFIAINMQGLHWGLPGSWNPDELVQYADDALRGTVSLTQSDDLSYPSLPKYVMYGLGKVVYRLGYSTETFRWSVRMLSVLLGGMVIFLVYKITRAAGGKGLAALTSSLLAMTFAEFSLDSHFAHNDIYVTFFSLLAILLLLRYRKTANRLFLYATFFTVGLAASCKYPAGALIIAVLIIYLFTEGKRLLKDILLTLETLFISACLSFLGFALGTPQSLFWMENYFQRLPHALYLLSNYNRTEASAIGFIQQWSVLDHALGKPAFILVILCLATSLFLLLAPMLHKKTKLPKLPDGLIILLISATALDLPMMISHDIKARFFISVILLLFILSSLIIELIITFLLEPRFHFASVALGIGVALIILVSAPRIASVILLFENDARTPAGEYLSTLPEGSTIEYTIYPPLIPAGHFANPRNYPINVIKYANEVVTDERYNLGEAGLMERHPDYLIIDSFTYDRFQNEQVCEWNPVECNFFKKLLAGEVNYTLIATFTYTLPDFLPDLNLSFLNPEIRIYQRGY